MKKNLQFMRVHARSLFLWAWLVLLSLSLTDAMGQATLPARHDGPWRGMTKDGWTISGDLGEDYFDELGTSSEGGSSNFNSEGDNLVLNFNGTPGELTYYATFGYSWENNFLGEFLIEESDNGSSYTVLRSIKDDLVYSANGTLYTDFPKSTTRYIRFRFLTQSEDMPEIMLDAINLTANSGPGINIKEGSADYATGSNYTFATQNVKTTSNPVSFTITNTGVANLNLTGSPIIKISGANADEFKINQTATASSIAAGSSTAYTVSFEPLTAGTKTATLSILNNTADKSNYLINLTGVAEILAPVILSISPSSGPTGTAVVIKGSNLINTTGVAFNGTAASFTVNNNNQITATVHSATPTGPGVVTVTNLRTTANGPSFTVVAQPVPEITSFTPAQGPIGQEITITGKYFLNISNVRFNGTPASYTRISDTELKATVPAGATSGKLSVTTLGGTVESASDFSVLLLPTITGISPDSGPVGQSVIITGTNFTASGTTVSFNGTPAATYTVNNSTQITVTVPPGASTGAIKVTTPGGSVSSTTFTVVLQAPFVSSISPASGPVGQTVVITGVNFSSVTGVNFNGTSSRFRKINDTRIEVPVPAGATTGPINLIASNGSIGSSSTFIVTVPAPTITSISPNSGLVGQFVDITGTNFSATASVSFNGKPASIISSTATKITTQVPAGATSGQITVTTSGGTAKSEIFTVVVPNTTYTWNVSSGNWSEAGNWTPARTNITEADILIFNGETQGNPTVNLDFATSQTIGQIKFLNGVIANLSVNTDKVLNLDNGVAGTDFEISSKSTVIVTNSAENASLAINITNGETGNISGSLLFQGGADALNNISFNAAHRITAEQVDGLAFQNGSYFRTAANYSGYPFGTTNLNTVRFASGSTLQLKGGSSPFGATAPNSVINFDAGSLYKHEAINAPDLNNRTYSNFELDNSAFAQTVTGTGNLSVNSLTVTNATNFNVNLSGTITITGNINVANGALNFNPATLNAINMSGTGTKVISGTGTMSLGANARLFVPASVVVDLQKQIIGAGSVIVDGIIRTNIEGGFAAGDYTALHKGVLPVLKPGSIIEYNGLGAQTVSPIDYQNLVISGNRSGNTITLAPGTIRVAETFTNPVTIVVYNTANNTVEFNGGNQMIPVLPYNNLTASGTASKSLAGNIQVNGNVNVITATINTGENRIILDNTATLSESQTSYVMGKVEATRNVTAGSIQNFGGVGLTLAPTASSLSPGSTRVVRSTGIGAIQLTEEKQSITRVYDITAANSTGLNTAITLKYAPNELSSGQEEAKLSMYKKEGANPWLEQAGSYTRSPVQRTISLTGVTGFSSWTLGEQSTLLPVELVQFTAARRGQSVQLNWTTAMELDNKGFEVQVSTDAQNFEPVSFIDSKNSNSKELQQYSFVDNKTKPADVLYYRLKQVDFDGTETYSAVKAVTYKKEQIAITATAYPNPFSESFTVVVNADAQKIASLTITDAMGKKVMEKTVTLTKGSNDVKFSLGNQYPSGIYIINITTNNFQQNLKMVKK